MHDARVGELRNLAPSLSPSYLSPTGTTSDIVDKLIPPSPPPPPTPFPSPEENPPEAEGAIPRSAPRRGPGHRGVDMRDTVAEMAEKAQLISQEAGSKVSYAMKDVISAAAGLAGFAIESARDLVQYMVRRGQMTQEEADKLIREAEAAHDKKPATEKGRLTATRIAADRAALAKAEAAARAGVASAGAGVPPLLLAPVAPKPETLQHVAVPRSEPVAKKSSLPIKSSQPTKGGPTVRSTQRGVSAKGSRSRTKPEKKAAPKKAASKKPAPKKKR